MSKQRIRQWYDHWDGMVYVSFSGGKDSTVLKHLVEHTTGVYDVPSLFVDTGLEYPEVRNFATAQPSVEVIRPEMRFDEVVKTYGYPVISKEVANMLDAARREMPWAIRKIQGLNKDGLEDNHRKRFKRFARYLEAPFQISDKCCTVMKKKPAAAYEKLTGRKAIVGTMACESMMRKTQWIKYGCNVFSEDRPVSKPLSFWTEQDVLEYIVKFNLPYASVYGEIRQDENGWYYTTGMNRTGCMFCMFGIAQDGCPNRFQRMKETHPRQYDFCMRPFEEKGLGLDAVLTYMEIDH